MPSGNTRLVGTPTSVHGALERRLDSTSFLGDLPPRGGEHEGVSGGHYEGLARLACDQVGLRFATILDTVARS